MNTRFTVLMFAALVMGGATFANKAATGKNDTLFNRLGGKKAITAVVDDFVTNCATDERIKSFFTNTAKNPARLTNFKNNLVNQICQAAGGPCKYTGKDMKTAHHGMGVKGEHFDALVEDLTKSLDKHHVAEADKSTLLGVLGPMKNDIVEEPHAHNTTTGQKTTNN